MLKKNHHPLKLFITGTDTNVGKTYISIGLLKAFNEHGYKTMGIKPIATGCLLENNKLYNDDALSLKAASSTSLNEDYDQVNPFAFEPAIAPHIAAARISLTLTVDDLINKTKSAFTHPADVYIIEGIGGWYVPLNDKETMADFVIRNDFSIILVVGIRLGCLNHAILTYQAIQLSSLNLVGWIANCIEADDAAYEMMMMLNKWFDVPCLGMVPFNVKPEKILTIQSLISKLSKG